MTNRRTQPQTEPSGGTELSEKCSVTQRNDVQSQETWVCVPVRFLGFRNTVCCDCRDTLSLSYTGCTCSLSRSGQRPSFPSLFCKLSGSRLPLLCPGLTLASIRSVLCRFLPSRQRRCFALLDHACRRSAVFETRSFHGILKMHRNGRSSDVYLVWSRESTIHCLKRPCSLRRLCKLCLSNVNHTLYVNLASVVEDRSKR